MNTIQCWLINQPRWYFLRQWVDDLQVRYWKWQDRRHYQNRERGNKWLRVVCLMQGRLVLHAEYVADKSIGRIWLMSGIDKLGQIAVNGDYKEVIKAAREQWSKWLVFYAGMAE